MSRQPHMAIATLIRNHDARPRTGGLLAHVHPGLREEFSALVDGIWKDLTSRFAAPLKIRESASRRTVTVLGFARYVVRRRDGRLTLEQKALNGSGRRIWRRAHYAFAADLPFKPSIGLFEELLSEWAPQLAALARSAADLPPLTAGLVRSVRRASLRSRSSGSACAMPCARRWRSTRRSSTLPAVRGSMPMPAKSRTAITTMSSNTLRLIARSTRTTRTSSGCMRWPRPSMSACRPGGRRSPPEGKDPEGLLAAPRRLALPRQRPAARLPRRARLAGTACAPDGRWLELREWLRVLVALERQDPVPLPVQRLFLHDPYRVASDRQSVLFRGASLPIATLRAVIAEAEAQLANGTLRAFAEDDLPDVLAWLTEADRRSTSASRRRDGTYLLRRARDWKHDLALRDRADSHSWSRWSSGTSRMD